MTTIKPWSTSDLPQLQKVEMAKTDGKFKSWLVKRPTKHYRTRQNYKDSLTIPGQGLTPHELVRLTTHKDSKFRPVFTDEPISSFQKMDALEKLDFLDQLAIRHQSAKQDIEVMKDKVRNKKLLQQKKAEAEAIRKDAIEKYIASKQDSQNQNRVNNG